jgi:hypothetical protein
MGVSVSVGTNVVWLVVFMVVSADMVAFIDVSAYTRVVNRPRQRTRIRMKALTPRERFMNIICLTCY